LLNYFERTSDENVPAHTACIAILVPESTHGEYHFKTRRPAKSETADGNFFLQLPLKITFQNGSGTIRRGRAANRKALPIWPGTRQKMLCLKKGQRVCF
jgi:hypothetical protein